MVSDNLSTTSGPAGGGQTPPLPPKHTSDSLTRSAGRGVLWQIVGAGWQSTLQLGASMVLARVLFPADYGMLGMALQAQAFIGRIGALGTSAGIIAKKDADLRDFSTAFWLNAAVQGLLFVVLFMGAPLVAMYFKSPDLPAVTRAICFTCLFNAFSAVPGAILRKRLRFGTLKIIESSAFALQCGIAIVLAVVLHWAYWSLVWAILVSSLAATVATLICARWRPAFAFSRDSFRYQIRFGLNEFGTSIVYYFHLNLPFLLIGRMFGASSMGLYEFAHRIPFMLFNSLAMPVSGVLFPALATVRDQDDLLARGYIKTARYIGFIVFPALGGLAALAHPVVLTIWGPKWVSCVTPLIILCAAAGLRCSLYGASILFLCKNRPSVPFKFSFVQVAVTFVAVGSLGYFFGLVGVAVGVLVAATPEIVLACMALRMTHSSGLMLVRGIWPPLAATLACMLAALAVRYAAQWIGLPPWSIVLLGVPAGGLTYVAVLMTAFGPEAREVWQTVKLTLGGRR